MNSIQSFNLDNFQKIFDYENRKGNNIEKRYSSEFSNSLSLLPLIKEKMKQLRLTNNNEERLNYLEERTELRNRRIEAITETIKGVVSDISLRKNKLSIIKGDIYGKQSYHFADTLENFFISKQTQHNIKRLYAVKPAHRNTIIKDIINLLEDKIPKYIVRTDIKSFFESIPQYKLMKKLNDDYLLSVLSKRFINETIESYNELTLQLNKEKAKGVPRGIGFSSYLAELFMREIDNEIKKIEDVVYYARYVDDIIVIFSPNSKYVDSEYIDAYFEKINIIIENSGLKLNNDKTKKYNLLNGVQEIEIEANFTDATPKELNYQKSIEFLGYSIGGRCLYSNASKQKIKNTKIIIDMVAHKKDRYIDKITKAFQAFEKKKMHNNYKAYKLLETRIQYLTTNTQLINNKENVFVGLFYSNKYINTMHSINALQEFLTQSIDTANLTASQKSKLYKYNFQSGYIAKTYHRYSIANKTHKQNKGITEFGLIEINSIW